MVKPQLISETPISMVDLKENIAEIKKRDEELGFRATKTEEYLNQFVKLDKKEAEDLKKKIEALDVKRLNESMLIKILDIVPINVEELKTIFQSSVVSVSKKDMEAIIQITKEYASEEK